MTDIQQLFLGFAIAIAIVIVAIVFVNFGEMASIIATDGLLSE